MENVSFEKTQRYLMQLLGYLEGLHSSMEWESMKEGPSKHPTDLPTRIQAILTYSGSLEGMRLKAQGCLSSDILEFIQTVGMAFEIEPIPQGIFKLPFLDAVISIQRKTLNDFMEKAWFIYHAALLSAYALRPLQFERLPSVDGLEETLRIIEAPDPSPDNGTWSDVPPDTVHTLNNILSGILGYVSLILEERKSDPDLQEKLASVVDAAKRAAAVLPKP